MADRDHDQAPALPPERAVSAAEAMQNRQRRAAQEAERMEPAQLDETVPGGRYLLDDGETVVDANGKPLQGPGKA